MAHVLRLILQKNLAAGLDFIADIRGSLLQDSFACFATSTFRVPIRVSLDLELDSLV